MVDRVEGYGQYCPVALGAEVFAERWTPIIVRNLMDGAERFGGILDGAPGLPRSVLAQRLRSLERAGVVERSVDGAAPPTGSRPAGRSWRRSASRSEVGRALAGGPAGAPRPVPGHPHAVADDRPRRAAAPPGGGPLRRARRAPAEPAVAGRGERRARGVRDRPGLRRRRRRHVGRRHARRLALRPAHAGAGAASRDAGRRDAGRRADARRVGAAQPVRGRSAPAASRELGAHARRARPPPASAACPSPSRRARPRGTRSGA